jgi:hypothetical protein
MKHLLTLLLLPLSTLLFAFGNTKTNLNPNDPILLARANGFMQQTSKGFEENKGQVTGEDANRVKFLLKDGNLSLFLMNDGIAYQFNRVHYPEGYTNHDKLMTIEERQKMEELSKDIRTETYRMDVQLVGANQNARITTDGKNQDYVQYYNHNALNVSNFSKVTYHEVYPFIDWVVYTTNGEIKYDFVVRPGGNPNQIKLKTNWVEELTLNADGSLTMKNILGEITEKSPISFQGEEKIKTNFSIDNDQIYFKLDAYNTTETLIIDPNLTWSTYYGGSNAEQAFGCVLDGSGNIYIAGWSSSANNIASGGHQNTFGGGSDDAMLIKFNSSGVRLWATYYGGSGNDQAYACAFDGSNIYIAGRTSSTTDIAVGGHQNTYGAGSYDAFLVKFNSDGIRLWGTYYGGNNLDEGRGCAVDGSGNVYLAGFTVSFDNIGFNGHQNTSGLGVDGFLVKFNSSGVRQWGTFYGANGQEEVYGCAADASGNVYIAGHTTSNSAIAFNGFQNFYAGGSWDAFLVKFNTDGIRQWGTYYGGNDSDHGRSCSLDGLGNVYLAGNTSSMFDIASGGHQNSYGFNGDAYLVKFNSDGVRQWGTYYGGSAYDYGRACFADANGDVYLTGETESTNAIASGGYQNTYQGGKDAFLVKFDNDGVRQWGTYFGGTGWDEGLALAADGSGNVYLAGWTTSNTGIAINGHQNTYGGSFEAFLAKFGCENGISLNATICAGDSYLFEGQTLTIAGVYTEVLTNIAGCDSLVTLNLTVNPIPAAPTGLAAQEFCNSATVANLSATGTAIQWYAAASGGTALTVGTVLNNGTTYHASQTVNGCESTDRLAVTVTINTPATPTGTANQEFCNAATVADLTATGSGIEWYTAPSGGTALTSGTALSNGTYYASQTISGCESINRLEVTVTINTPAAPTGTANQSFCGTATLADITVTGANITWYDAASAGTVLGAGTALADGVTYFASQTVNGCESINRLAVTATVNAIPSAPAASASQEFCNGATVADLTATGSGVQWFTAASGGTALTTGTALASGSYFAAQTVNGCESTDRTEVTVNIITPATPSGDAAQNFCSASTVADLTATGTAIQWYTQATGGTALAAGTALSNGTYYASQTINGCESERLEVTVTVTVLDATVTENGLTLTSNQAGATYTWVDCNNSNQPIAGATAQSYTATANGSYAVIVEQNGCSVTSNCVAITTVGLDDIKTELFRIYPNPASTVINVEMANTSTIRLFDISGKLLKELNGSSNYTIDVTDLTPGMYMIESAEGAKAKFVKQ